MKIHFNSSVLKKPYIINPTTQREVTYRELLNKTTSIENLINEEFKLKNSFSNQSEGITCLVLISQPDLLIASILACWKNNLSAAVISPNLPQEQYKILNERYGFSFLITDNDKLKESNESLFKVLRVREEKFDQPTFEAFELEFSEEKSALLLFSSGTTGIPKCIPLSINNINHNIDIFSKQLKFKKSNLFVCGSPLWHAHGLYNSFLTSFFLQNTVIYAGQLSIFNINSIFSYVKNVADAIFHITPSMIPICLSYAERNRDENYPKFHKVICGTSFLDNKSKEKFENTFKSTIMQQYGMTETLFMTVNTVSDKEKSNSVGQPLPEVELQIVDENDNILQKETNGFIRVKSNSCFGTYFQPTTENEVFKLGYFYTGDCGYLDKDNYLFLTGREKDIIKKGGFSVSAQHISNLILSTNNILEAYTLGVNDENLGEEIYSFYISNHEIRDDEIRNNILKEIPKNMLPKKIFRIKEMPKTESGKVKKEEMFRLLNQMINN